MLALIFQRPFFILTGSESELTAGNHNFPFRVQLKTGLPTSYEGSTFFGHEAFFCNLISVL